MQGLSTKTPGTKAIITGQIQPPDPGGGVIVTLFAKGSPFKKAGRKIDLLDANSRFKAKIGVPDDAKKCRADIKYEGNVEATKKFSC